MDRRGFLRGILAAVAAPAIVRAQSLMPVAPRIWTPPWVGIDFGADQGTVIFAHPSWYEEMLRVSTVTGECALYQGELYSYGVKIIPSELPLTPVLAREQSIFDLTRENIAKAIRRIEADTARRVVDFYRG